MGVGDLDIPELDADADEFTVRIRNEAVEALENEPHLCTLLRSTVLAKDVKTFEEAVASTMCYRLLLHACNGNNNNGAMQVQNGELPIFCPNSMRDIFLDAMNSDELEYGSTMKEAIRKDAMAVFQRDPACESLLEVILFYKGYAALVCHRAARRKWNKSSTNSTKKAFRSFVSLFLQSQASSQFGIDIHPCATIGCGVMFDHGTGVVIGETARLGDGCTILHGVTLGGTGKDKHVDRHPKVGDHVLIGANASILGNIPIGNRCKIGAGSVVLRELPSGVTAVGVPAKIIGTVIEEKPGSDIDENLKSVSYLHKSDSYKSISSLQSQTTSTASLSTLGTTSPSPTISKTIKTTTVTIDDKLLPNIPSADADTKMDAATSREPEQPKDEGKDEEGEEQEDNESNNGNSTIDTPTASNNNGNTNKKISGLPKPKRGRSKSLSDAPLTSGGEEFFCPFREYKRMGAAYSPKNSITIKELGEILRPLGVPPEEIGSCFLALMGTKQVGYIALDDVMMNPNDDAGNNHEKRKFILDTLQTHLKCCANNSTTTETTTNGDTKKEPILKLEPEQVLQKILCKCS